MAICHWPQSMTKAYGQSSKKCHWQWSMTKKLSLTMVNDKKNCHWLKVIYIGIYHNNWALLVFLIKPPSSILLIIIYFCIIYSVYCWSRLFPRDGLEYCWCSSRDLCNSSPDSILSKQYFVHALNAALVVTFLWYQEREIIFVVHLVIKWPIGRLNQIPEATGWFF